MEQKFNICSVNGRIYGYREEWLTNMNNQTVTDFALHKN